jgi:hypothetical protein
MNGRYYKYTFWSPLFLRDQPWLCNSMHRITTMKSGKAQTLASKTTFMSKSVKGPMSQPNTKQELQLNPLLVNVIPPAFMMSMMPIQPVCVWPMPQFFVAYEQSSFVIKHPGNTVSPKRKQHHKRGIQKQSKLPRPVLPKSPSKKENSQQLKLMQSVKRNEKTETLQKNMSLSNDELVAAIAIAALGVDG